MKIVNGKFGRRKKTVSREERAEKLIKHFHLQGDAYKGLMPRLGLAVVFVVLTLVLFPPSRRTQEVVFQAGEIADRNIIAPFEFEVPLSDADLDLERSRAALKVLPVYERQRLVESEMAHNLGELFDTLSTVNSIDTLTREQKIDLAENLLPYLSRKMVRDILTPAVFAEVRSAAIDYQHQIYEQGFIDDSRPLRRGSFRQITVIEDDKETGLSTRDLVDQGRVDDVIQEEGFRRFPKSRNRAQVFFEIVRSNLLPNLVLNSEETERRRASAMEQVAKTIKVYKNQRIIGKHDKVTAEQERMLGALERARANREAQQSPVMVASLYTAEVLRLFVFGLLFGGYIYVFHRKVYRDISKLSTILFVFMMYLVFMAVVVRFSLSPFLVPVAFVSLMITALFDFRLGLVTTVFACFLIPLVTDFTSHIGFVSLLAGTAAVVGLLKMRARSHFYSVFLIVSVGYIVGILGTELGQVEKFRDLYTQSGWAIANSLFSSLSVMFLLPIFEGVFNLTTRFTLLELTDLNKPILKRLNMEAPGTYHHSMLLGSLADAVASDVGADPLRARVIAYYHDIGKIFKPEYYAENQEAGFNKHEKITPQMSSLILLSHVKDGVELAREEKLPDLIIDAIQQHHGTTVMAFFYQKALETDSHSSVNKDDFRYPGPRPQSKETAILMLADAVEPACRSLADPTAAHIRNMVVKLIDARAHDGELNESGLTLNDLARIKEKFVSILTGIYHKRVAYPGTKEEEREGEAIVKPV